MKYEEMFPDTEVGVEATPGLTKLEEEAPCANCGEPSSWHCTHIDMVSCSVECHTTSTQKWLGEQRDKWITDSLVDGYLADDVIEDGSGNPVGLEGLLRQQHNYTIARLIEWAKNEQLAFYYINVPRDYPFQGNIPVLPVRGIPWAEVLAMVVSPTEESDSEEELALHVVTDPTAGLAGMGETATIETQDDIEEHDVDLDSIAPVLSPVDPLGDEDEEDAPEDEDVWIGNNLIQAPDPEMEDSDVPREPINLRAFADSLEEDREDTDDLNNYNPDQHRHTED